MSFPRYPEYKDSGVEWLGEVPAHWIVAPLRGAARQKAYSFTDGDWVESPFITDEGVRLIQTGNIGVGEYREQGFRFVSEDTFRKLNCTEVLPGDVLICRLADPVGRACLAPELGSRMITSVDVCILRTHEEIDSKYLVYFLSSTPYLSFMASASRGGTRERVSRSFLATVRVSMPNLDEQQAITAFLDHETAKIDALVQEQQRLIELLKEKRQAVISHAVTKGLDPDVPMKDSGVEWLGEVPEHWRIGALRWYATIQGGLAKGKDTTDLETQERPYLRVANVQDGHLNLSDVHTIQATTADIARASLKMDDVLMNEGGDNDKLGRGTVWKEEIQGCLHQNHVFAIRPGEELSAYWLATFTRGASARAYFYLGS